MISPFVLQIFLVTGGEFSDTTEILQEKKWKVLATGNLPAKINGLSLITIDNNVFSFGKIKNFDIFSLNQHFLNIYFLRWS